ncbi:MAG TPA: L,D-transpeptidase [Xanthobacteraceae bacterium]|jgi:lipoprotein-anchoring transpeptidase ErfK/SrfK
MSKDHRGILGIEGVAVCTTLLMGSSTGATAQYYCDERFQSCQAYHQPAPIFPFGLFRQREPAPRAEPALPVMPTRPAYAAPAADMRQYAALYASVRGEPFPIAAVRLSDINPEYLRKTVYYRTSEAPGTIIIDTPNRFLYFIEGGGRAIRYGVGVGRQGFAWSGVAAIHDKQEWPDWYPPKEMIARQPELRRHLSELQSGLGMPGGPPNPLGARAMYLWQGSKDTLYRIHGTFEPWTIGTNVSSGCIRMINQDAIDLYDRAPLGARVVVLPARS